MVVGCGGTVSLLSTEAAKGGVGVGASALVGPEGGGTYDYQRVRDDGDWLGG